MTLVNTHCEVNSIQLVLFCEGCLWDTQCPVSCPLCADARLYCWCIGAEMFCSCTAVSVMQLPCYPTCQPCDLHYRYC